MMLITLHLIVASEFTIAMVYQVPLLRIESKMTQMMRKGTWASHVEQVNAWRLKNTEMLSDSDIYSQDVSGVYVCPTPLSIRCFQSPFLYGVVDKITRCK